MFLSHLSRHFDRKWCSLYIPLTHKTGGREANTTLGRFGVTGVTEKEVWRGNKMG
jgi:hypothetical protein